MLRNDTIRQNFVQLTRFHFKMMLLNHDIDTPTIEWHINQNSDRKMRMTLNMELNDKDLIRRCSLIVKFIQDSFNISDETMDNWWGEQLEN